MLRRESGLRNPLALVFFKVVRRIKVPDQFSRPSYKFIRDLPQKLSQQDRPVSQKLLVTVF